MNSPLTFGKIRYSGFLTSLFLLLFLILPFRAFAQTVTLNNVVYQLNPNGYEPGTCMITQSPDFAGTTLNVPATVSYGSAIYTVVSVGAPSGDAVFPKGTLERVIFEAPLNIISIGSYAFKNNPNLTSINLAECKNITELGYEAFRGTGLSELNLSNLEKLETIRYYCFADCASLTIVDISGCTALKSIAGDAFLNCNALESFDSSNCPSLAGMYAIFGTKATLNNLTNLNFSGCTSLGAVGGDSFPTMKSGSTLNLSGCTKLTSLGTFPNKRVSYVNLTGCTALKSIPDKCFYNSSTKQLILTGCTSISKIGTEAFRQLAIEEIIGIEDCPITTIGTRAFYGCPYLTSLVFNLKNITEIGAESFSGCTKLNSNISNLANSTTLTSIGSNAFYNCNQIKEYDFSGCKSLKRIGDRAFYSNSIESINLEGCSSLVSLTGISGNNLNSINLAGCSSLTEFSIIKAPLLSTLNMDGCNLITSLSLSGSTVMENLDISSLSLLNSLSIDSYKALKSLELPANAPITSIKLTNDSILPEVDLTSYTGVTDFLFTNCYNLKTIGDISGWTQISSIPPNAFSGCKALQSINLTGLSNIKSIGTEAFRNCDALKSIDLSSCTDITAVEPYTFYSCDSLKTINFSGCTKIESIGNYAFGYCRSLTSIGDPPVFPELQTIGRYAFYATSSLKLIDLSKCESLTTIEQHAFAGSGVEIMIWPASVTTVGSWCIAYSDKLKILVSYISSPPWIDTKDNVLFANTMKTEGTLYCTGTNIYRASPGWRDAHIINPISSFYQISSINLRPTISIDENVETAQITATVNPGNAVYPVVTWKVEPEGIVEIVPNSESSLTVGLKPLQSGECLLTAMALDGSYTMATSTVTVSAVDITGLNPGEGATTVSDITNPGAQTASGAIINDNVIVMRVGQKAVFNLNMTPTVDFAPETEWQFSEHNVVSITENPNQPGQFTLEAFEIGDTDYSVSIAGASAPCFSGKIRVIAENPITSFQLSPTEAVVPLNDTNFSIQPVFEPETPSVTDLVWYSTNDRVATVDPTTGKLTLLATGDTWIMAATTDGTKLEAMCELTVSPKILTGITLSESEVSIPDGLETTVSVESYEPDDAPDQTFEWRLTENYGVVSITVSKDTKSVTVTALKPGTCLLTATATDGSGTSAACSVEVLKVDVTAIDIEGCETVMKVGEWQNLTAIVTPSNATSPKVIWTVTPPGLASVVTDATSLESVLTATDWGMIELTAAWDEDPDINKTISVKILPAIPVESLELSPEAMTVALNTPQVNIEPVFTPAVPTVTALKWASSNPAVAEIDPATGVVTLKALGQTTITATTMDGTEISASMSLTVTEAIAEEFIIDAEEIVLEVGETYEVALEATSTGVVLPSTITWISSAPLIASVEGKADGMATIQAWEQGVATVTASATVNGKEVKASCTVTVNPISVKTLMLSVHTLTIDAGDNPTLSVDYTPADAEPDLNWSVADPTILSIVPESQQTFVGLKPLKAGTTTVRVEAGNSTGLYDECEVTVTEAAGLDSILGDGSDSVFDIYDSAGRLVQLKATPDTLKTLSPGIYIFVNGNESKKVLVR